MTDIVFTGICLLASYLLGAVPWGYILARRFKGVDVTKSGSGNIGFANVLRVAGTVPGVFTLILDTAKGYVAVAVVAPWCAHRAPGLQPEILPLAAFAAVVGGHICSVFLRFRGGKGMATAGGALLALAWPVLSICLAVWLIVVWFTRYISLGSIAAALALAPLMLLFGKSHYAVIFSAALSAVVVARHYGNIKRLLKGKENRLEARKLHRGDLARLVRRYQKKRSKVAVLGDGGWGTALALLLFQKGEEVALWGAFPDYVAEMRSTRLNSRYLPGVEIPSGLEMTGDMEEALRGADAVILAVPSAYMREICARAREFVPPSSLVLSVAKGLELGSLKRMSEVAREELSVRQVAVLSGPSHAEEVARGLPTTVVTACADLDTAYRAQALLLTERFRVYSHDDVVGVEMGGVLKNVIAIAAGICDGCGFGDNTKAALLTRGIVEISRLVQALGGRPETVWGLSGVGDLIATSFSPYGRNLRFGRMVGEGIPVEEALAGTRMVVEGVAAARAAWELARRFGTDMPIVEQVHAILYERKSVREALRELMNRDPKGE